MAMSVSVKANRLIHEKSPYLLQHAYNPVDWYAWGEEAFAAARSENKPVFLSVGYSTCHWCHVMEHESFENETVAAVMNRYFVNIKVDREERPDVDRIYMAFVQATTGQGGWPLSAWLTPELKPFIGGTYFPPEDRQGRPGFSTVLQEIAGVWERENSRVLEHGRKVVESLYAKEKRGPADGGTLKVEWAEKGCQRVMSTFDEKNGGFGGAPKFPRPALMNFLFRTGMRLGLHHETGGRAVEMALVTLRKMADGGMYDHVGGGFHRYSVDESWHVPHFEKMLYDQAQLAISYTEAWQIAHEPCFEKKARGILNYVMRDLRHPEGGFYSAEDADSLPSAREDKKLEGAFYVWAAAELKELLGEEMFRLFAACYGVEKEGNCAACSDPHGELTGRNVLKRSKSDEELATLTGLKVVEVTAGLERALQILQNRRADRPRPHLDDKILTAWNGLMISAFARASIVWDEKSWLDCAQSAAEFVKKHLKVEGTADELLRSWRTGGGKISGYAADYAFLIQGLLDLYEAGADMDWLQWAVQLQKRQDVLFRDAEAGDYFVTRGDDPHLIVRMKEDYDGAEPSADAVTASNLLRLSVLAGCGDYYKQANGVLAAFEGRMQTQAMAVPQMLAGLELYLSKPVQVLLLGNPVEARNFAVALRQKFRPALSILYASRKSDLEWLAVRMPYLKGLDFDGRASARLCRDNVCQLPVHCVEDLLKQAD